METLLAVETNIPGRPAGSAKISGKTIAEGKEKKSSSPTEITPESVGTWEAPSEAGLDVEEAESEPEQERIVLFKT